MTTTDDKTPNDRPAPLAADHPSDPANKPPEEQHPRDLAAYVKALPTKAHVDGMEKEIASILDRVAQLEALPQAHAELASIVDGQAGELQQIHGLLGDIAAATRARSAQRTRDRKSVV
jgi:hypothetical protein